VACGGAQPAPMTTQLPQIFVRCAAPHERTALLHGDSIIQLGVMVSSLLRRYVGGGCKDLTDDSNQYKDFVVLKGLSL
jgi:hypothetical protein